MRMLEESVRCVRLLLTEAVANFEGEFFNLRDARCEPKPVQRRLPIWIGGGGGAGTVGPRGPHPPRPGRPLLHPPPPPPQSPGAGGRLAPPSPAPAPPPE